MKSTAPPKKSKKRDSRWEGCNIEIENRSGATTDLKHFPSEIVLHKTKVFFGCLQAFVLLRVKWLQEQPHKPLHVTVPGLCVLTREVQSRKEIRFPANHVALWNIISQKARWGETNFYAIRKLKDTEPTELPVLHAVPVPLLRRQISPNSDDSFASAQSKAQQWQNVCGHLKINFVEATSAILVMPILKIPCNMQDRMKFVDGVKDSLCQRLFP